MIKDFLSPSENGSYQFVGGRARKKLRMRLVFWASGRPEEVTASPGRLRMRSIWTGNH